MTERMGVLSSDGRCLQPSPLAARAMLRPAARRLAAVGIGFAGGTGSAWGAIVGAVVLGIISNILNLLGVDSYVQQIINGAIIVLAVGLDTFTRSLRVSQ